MAYNDQLRSLGLHIKASRKKRDLTQEELAVALDVSAITVSRWETGKQAPDYLTLTKLVKLLGTSIPTLTAEEKTDPADPTTPHDIPKRRSQFQDEYDAILGDLVAVNPDIVTLVHEIGAHWDEMDAGAKQTAADGLTFVLGSIKASLKKKRE